eukprot:3907187-Pyramimonas_sp.AAC.1
MRPVKLRSCTKPCCAMWVRSATAPLMRWLAAPAMAFMSVVFSEGGRRYSGARSVANSPKALPPAGWR